MNDPYPTPHGALEPDSGPAASRYLPCETCRARGEVRVPGGWQLCLICDGTGERRRARGEPEWDAYLEMPLADAVSLPMGPPRPARIVQSAEPEMYAWERLRSSYDRHGSYRRIRVELDRLSLVHPSRHRLVRAVLVEREPRELGLTAKVELDAGVLMIALRVGKVRVPPWLIERAGAERQLTIDELAAQGFRAGEIARRLGLTKEAVRRKLRRSAVRSAQAGIPARAM